MKHFHFARRATHNIFNVKYDVVKPVAKFMSQCCPIQRASPTLTIPLRVFVTPTEVAKHFKFLIELDENLQKEKEKKNKNKNKDITSTTSDQSVAIGSRRGSARGDSGVTGQGSDTISELSLSQAGTPSSSKLQQRTKSSK